eukprot:6809298-Pyramimonas_sp.AAC.1
MPLADSTGVGPAESSAGCAVLSRSPADPSQLAQSRGSDSRASAMSVNVGLSIPVVVVSG